MCELFPIFLICAYAVQKQIKALSDICFCFDSLIINAAALS